MHKRLTNQDGGDAVGVEPQRGPAPAQQEEVSGERPGQALGQLRPAGGPVHRYHADGERVLQHVHSADVLLRASPDPDQNPVGIWAGKDSGKERVRGANLTAHCRPHCNSISQHGRHRCKNTKFTRVPASCSRVTSWLPQAQRNPAESNFYGASQTAAMGVHCHPQ